MPLPKDPLKYENDLFTLLSSIADALKYTSAARPMALELKFNTVQKARNVRFRIHAFLRALEKELASRNCREEVEIYRDEMRAASFALFRLEGTTVRILDRRYNTGTSSLGNVLSDVESQLEQLREREPNAQEPSIRDSIPAAALRGGQVGEPAEPVFEYPSSIVVDDDPSEAS